MRATNDRAPDATNTEGQSGQTTETILAPDNPFAENFAAYWNAGWRSILPMPHRKKFPPPAGSTGRDAQRLSFPDLQAYADEGKLTNIALHMAETFIGVDVDDYDDKPGAATLNQLESELGALPPTYVSTARTGTRSGVRIFRVPLGVEFINGLPGIEICQAHHRYVMVWPSYNPNAKGTYRWIDEATGEVLDAPPHPDNIPALPGAWVQRLRAENRGHGDKAGLDETDVAELLLGLPHGEPCEHIQKAAGKAMLAGSRHDSYLKTQLAVVSLGRMGCPGAREVLERLRATFVAEVVHSGTTRRSQSEAEAEWQRGLVGAAQIAGDGPQLEGCPGTAGATFSPASNTAAPLADADAGSSERALTLTPAASIKPRRVCWLWLQRMALGALSLVAGPEGLGKSTLVYWLVAFVTRGLLPGEYFGKPKSVLIAATEDSWAHTVVPRLMAAGADLERVYRVDVTTSLGTDGALSLPADIPAMGRAVQEVDASLLVLDPLTSRLSANLDTHKDSETRLALEPLVAFADRYNVAVVGIMHFNKSGSTDPLALVMASKAFTAVARSVSTVIKDPDDDTETARLFGTVKNNLGRSDLATLRFSIAGHRIDTDDGDAWTGKLVWGADAVGTIGDALVRATDTGDKTSTTEAAEWLSDYLDERGGSVDSADAKRAGHKAGHTADALKRACKRLGVDVESYGFPRKTRWKTAVGAQSAHIPRGDHPTTPTTPTGGGQSQSVQSVQSGAHQGTGAPTGTNAGFGDDDCPNCGWPLDSRTHTVECATAALVEVTA